MEIKVNALMLRAVDYNEYDKILTLLTAEYGKITAGIRGVKKAGAKLKFAAQPFCFAEYVLAERGGRYTVTGCSETESFYDLRTDVKKLYAASAVAEAALALAIGGDDCGEMFLGTVKALSQICSGDGRAALVNYLLFALKTSGYAVSCDVCPKCGKPLAEAPVLRFDMDSGAFTCGGCSAGPGASMVTLNAIRAAEGRPCYEEVTDEGYKRALRLLHGYFTHKTDAELRALGEYIKMLG